jgi:hypothetical protein
MQNICALKVRLGEKVKKFDGRVAWTLHQLMTAGASGCTTIDNPAPRWSDYVFKLRREGVEIETVTEKHGGTYAGHHARYILRSPVEILEAREAA